MGRAATGTKGLDAILHGGLPQGWLYLVQGEPGTGKTTLGLEFLLEGIRAGEKVLYITLSHSKDELEEIARSHGWSLAQMSIHELSAGEAATSMASEQSVLHPADVELGEMTETLIGALTRVEPTRVVFDAVEQLRLMTDSPLRYRRQLLSLKQSLSDLSCTALFLADRPPQDGDRELEGLVHGVLDLERNSRDIGGVARRLAVSKGRGMHYNDGYHSFRIRTGGLEVYPRIESESNVGHNGWEVVKSGVDELDVLLGGGLETGTTCLVVGPTGTGKTSVATLYAYTAAARGEHAAIFLFDERIATFNRRAAGIDMDIRPHVESGQLNLHQISTGELSPGEFAHRVRVEVEDEHAKVIVIDSLTGYLNAMPQENLLVNQMHELLAYLSKHDVLTLLVMAQSGVLGNGQIMPIDISYLADTVLLLRHFEVDGRLRRAISTIKKRHGPHEQTLRELQITSEGLRIGEPLTEFSHILSGSPVFEGDERALLAPGRQDDDES